MLVELLKVALLSKPLVLTHPALSTSQKDTFPRSAGLHAASGEARRSVKYMNLSGFVNSFSNKSREELRAIFELSF
jgi:hypothetical protein